MTTTKTTSSKQQDHDVVLEDVSLELHGNAGATQILRNINLRIAKGESVAIVGPSGSGKTSLLMIMGGLEPTTSGRVALGGAELVGRSEDELAEIRRTSVGIVFQSFHLVPTMTALDNVALPLEFAYRQNSESVATKALDDVGLAHRRQHYPSQMSGGEQQRVALARALAPQPGLLLADEPTGNLDARTGAEVADLIFALKQKLDMTFVLVTHDEKLAARCQRIIHIDDGQIVDDIKQPSPVADRGNNS